MKKRATKIIIDTIACISVSDCKKDGLFDQAGPRSADFYFDTPTGGNLLLVRATADLPLSSVSLEYDLNGEMIKQRLETRTVPSNIGGGVCRFFVCPVTGRACRTVYFVDGRFVSRHAFPARYLSQAGPRKKSTTVDALVYTLAELIESERRLESLVNQKHRKISYRGKLTPYGQRVADAKSLADCRFDFGRLLSKEIRIILPDFPGAQCHEADRYRYWRKLLWLIYPDLYGDDSPLIRRRPG